MGAPRERATRAEGKLQELREQLLLGLYNAPQYRLGWKKLKDVIFTVYEREKDDVRAQCVAMGLVVDVEGKRNTAVVRLTERGKEEAGRIAARLGIVREPSPVPDHKAEKDMSSLDTA